ncbi:XRE family transcriptional regulator [Clostridium novyi A str. BKT29909]|uniref:helix-turn-helix domain-containing protein n=1 Tax=Clostridium novyi TaxID=1542 RepID=UPI0004D3FF79|nr:helix-turn-helix transcriptional regulator [Clostridium novyi]KEH89627.1 XRE family transcriptional regulator [Clostridium novyi A str. BKT29909]
MSLGDNIKRIRKMHKMSIRDLVEISGVGKSTISDIENDKVSPTASTLQKIADALNISVNDLFDDKSNSNAPEEYTHKYIVTKKDKEQYAREMKKANEAFFLDDDLSEEAKKEMLDLMSELFWKAKALNKKRNKQVTI